MGKNTMRGLLLLLLAFPVIELYVLIQLIGVLGLIVTLVLLLSAAAVGTSLLKTQSLSTCLRVQQAIAQGDTPTFEVIEGSLLALSGLLLLIPGFLSDLLALSIFIPPIRHYLVSLILSRFCVVPKSSKDTHTPLVLEGEFEREE